MSRYPDQPNPEEEDPPPGHAEPHDLGLPGAFPPPADEAPPAPHAPEGEDRGPAVPGDALPVGQVIAVLGDITVTRHEVITPVGAFPLAGSEWTLDDLTQDVRVTPTWALVTAVAGLPVLCLFSLAFLVVKEDEVRGDVQVRARSNEIEHITTITVNSVAQARQVHHYFDLVRSLAASG